MKRKNTKKIFRDRFRKLYPRFAYPSTLEALTDEFIDAQAARLEKYKGISEFKIGTDGKFKFKTNLIFTRFDEDHDKRVCLGAFIVVLNYMGGQSFESQNLLYGGVGHWTFNMRPGACRNVCTGEYGPTIAALTAVGDIASAVDYIYIMLRDSKDSHVHRPVWLRHRTDKHDQSISTAQDMKLSSLKPNATLTRAKRIIS